MICSHLFANLIEWQLKVIIKIVSLEQKSSDLYKTGQLYKQTKLATAQSVVLSLISFGPKSRRNGKFELVT